MTLPLSFDPALADPNWRRRQRRLLALCLVVLAVALTLGLRSSGGGPSIRYATTPSSVRAYQLAVGVPRGFHHYAIRGGLTPTGTRPPVIGETLTNRRLDPQALHRLTVGLPAHGGTTGVVLQVGLFFTLGFTPAGQLHLPLGLDQRWYHQDLANGTLRWGLVHFRAQDYSVRVWIGRGASARDRAALLRALASVRPAQ